MRFEPEEIYYMITINCNQKCSKCSHWKRKDRFPRLSTLFLIDALKSIPTCKEFTIVGGEPLLYKDEIVEIIEGVASTKIRTVIITNAVLLTPNFVDRLKNYNVHFVFSIDTVEKEFWKFVRGCDSFDTVMSNLDYAFKNLSTSQISIQSVLSKETEAYIPAVRKFADAHHVFHSCQDYVSAGFEGHWTELKSEINNIPESTTQQCYATGRNLSIMQNGDVRTCFQQNLIAGCESPLGNLRNNSIKEMLESDYAQKILNAMKKCNKDCRVLKCNIKR